MEKNEKTREFVKKTKVELKEAQALSQKIRKEKIHPHTGMNRWQGWQEKRALGYNTRILLLAYAFIRGRKYAQVEAPNSTDIPLGKVVILLASTFGEKKEFFLLEVKAWMEASTPTEKAA